VTTEVKKKVVEKNKEEREERILFFLFFFHAGLFLVRPRGRPKLLGTRVKIHSQNSLTTFC
jgi:hypothetical protein